MQYNLECSWKPYLETEFTKPYMKDLLQFLKNEKKAGKIIYPDEKNVLEVFRLTPLSKVKVVIIGQDPYHGAGQAHGISFSVPKGIKIPPSLVNIYKELNSDLGIPIPEHGHLENWARQGVLLLNAVLTVEEGVAGSHHKKGWERFTDRVIEILSTEREHLVYILWGASAQKKASAVNSDKNFILKSVHPSPLSVYRGFLGSKPFSQTNAYLRKHGIEEIDWSLT